MGTEERMEIIGVGGFVVWKYDQTVLLNFQSTYKIL